MMLVGVLGVDPPLKLVVLPHLEVREVPQQVVGACPQGVVRWLPCPAGPLLHQREKGFAWACEV